MFPLCDRALPAHITDDMMMTYFNVDYDDDGGCLIGGIY